MPRRLLIAPDAAQIEPQDKECKMSGCKFRIYQGPQAGAQFELKAGRYLLGSGDNNDLIFTDDKLAPLHVVLSIDDDLKISLEPKDGDCYLNDEKVKESTTWTSGSFLKLGNTVMSFKDADAPWPDYDAYLLQKLNVLTENKAQEPESLEDEPKQEETTVEEPKKSHYPHLLSIILALILIVLLSALMFGPQYFRHDSKQEDFNKVNAVLDKLGYEISLKEEDGALALYGQVASQESLNKLLEALPQTSSALVLHLEIYDAYLLGIEKTLKIMGYDAKAKYKDNNLVEISAYIKDPYVEARLFTTLSSQYEQNFLRHIVYKDKLEELLLPKLKEKHLDFLTFNYTDGAIFYAGDLTLKERADLFKIRDDLKDELAIPLEFYNMQDLPKSRIETINVIDDSENTETVDKPVEVVDTKVTKTEPLNIEDIMGVTLEPLRFITLRNGHKYFEGGVLPSGFTVSQIDIHKIVVKRGNEVHEFKLR